MIITAEQHIQSEQHKRFPHATGAFSWLLSGITLATKMTQAKVRRGALLGMFGDAGTVNAQGESQQKLDVYANQALLHCLRMREDVAVLASEENDDPVMFEGRAESGKYVVVVDPFDGSSNIDVNVGVGTIFSILAKPPNVTLDNPDAAVLQVGTRQIAAGYVVYGSSTIMVYTTGNGVHGFTLDPEIGAYVLSHENIRMPAAGRIYSVNEANVATFPHKYQRYLARLRSGAVGTPVHFSLHRVARGRFSSHAAQGWCVSVSTNTRLSQGQVALAIRSESNRFHCRAGWRGGHRWSPADSGN